MDEHYYTGKPTSELRRGLLKAFLRGRDYKFITASGVFSPKRIDNGTRLLVENMLLKPSDAVFDLGCGYGVIGIVAAKEVARVLLIDVNSRAVALARENLDINNVTNAEVRRGKLYEPVEGEKFDAVLCNLPMSAGLDVVYEIIDGAIGHLKPGGSAQFVVRKGAKRIEARMKTAFGNVRTLAKKGGYRVYESTKPG